MQRLPEGVQCICHALVRADCTHILTSHQEEASLYEWGRNAQKTLVSPAVAVGKL